MTIDCGFENKNDAQSIRLEFPLDFHAIKISGGFQRLVSSPTFSLETVVPFAAQDRNGLWWGQNPEGGKLNGVCVLLFIRS